MVKTNPADRATISQIKESKWYKGPTYSEKQMKKVLDGRLKSIYEKENINVKIAENIKQ